MLITIQLYQLIQIYTTLLNTSSNNISLYDLHTLIAFTLDDTITNIKVTILTRKSLQIKYSTFQLLLLRIHERLQKKPLSYIIKQQTFYNYIFSINSHTLIPREETELIVQNAIRKILHISQYSEQIKILDLCTGSGAIITAIAKEMEKYTESSYIKYQYYASDISKQALKIAQHNFDIITSQKQNVNFIKSDLFQEIPIKNKFHIITCNPPYVDQNHWQYLSQEIQKFEPKSAFTPKQSVYLLYQTILQNCALYLHKNMFAIIEIGCGQLHMIYDIISKIHNLNIEEIKYDFSNIARCIIIKKTT